ncbi:MAG: hypothetical protein KAI83_04560 [Thiomargarita sp.]|nr:hypothetical protein [Thiomargarita sp.]
MESKASALEVFLESNASALEVFFGVQRFSFGILFKGLILKPFLNS